MEIFAGSVGLTLQLHHVGWENHTPPVEQNIQTWLKAKV